MVKVIKIEGLDCPNCARSLESAIKKIDIVNEASIDFVKGTISFESEKVEESIKKIKEVTNLLEPQAKIIVKKEKVKNNDFIISLITLFLGIVLGIISLVVNMPSLLYWVIFVTSLLLLGYKTYYKAVVLLSKGMINENLLLTMSVIGATIINREMEAIMVIALYSFGKVLEGLAVNKSRKSIEKLTNLQPEYAILKEGKEEKRVEPKEVLKGSIIIVRPGERVPIDGIIVKGEASLDMQSLTGESLPVLLKTKDSILSGSIVLDGVLEIETTSDYSDSTVSRILNLIENAAEKKSKTETLISKITRWYTLGVLLCALLVGTIVYLVTSSLDTSVYRGLIFLVVSCPCAFAISVPLSYFSGIGNASRHGILIKGSNYLDACSKLKLVVFDKTGTLTTGKFIIKEIKRLNKDYNEEEVLYLASLGEQYSLHPLAKSITSFNKRKLEEVDDLKEIAGEGVYFNYKKDKYFVGRKDKTLKATIVEVYKNDSKLANIYLEDQIKETAKEACKELGKLKIETALLSGDNEESVQRVKKEIGINNAYSNMLPEEKYHWLEEKRKEGILIGYVGDGINDSPSLMLADVGISMGINGSPASIEASDIVLVDDNPYCVSTAVKISKFTQKIVWQNIILSAGIKFLFLALGSFGVTGMLSAVFADVGVTVLAILNSIRALRYSPNKQ